MPARLTRNTVILAKIETTYGTDSVPTGASNAVLCSSPTVNPLSAQNVGRDLVRPFLGGSEQLVGTAFLEVSFDVELQSSGAAGTAPAWGPLLRACGFSETVSASQRVEYAPVSSAFESVSIYYYDDGALHKLLGARGSFEIKAGVGERPVLSFKFIGLDGGVTAATNPSATLTAWKTPAVITDANTGDLLFGCTYATGALSAGTPYPSKGISVSSGISVAHTPMLGGETVELTQREVTASFELDLTAAQEVTFMDTVKANTTQSIGIQHGTAAGSKIILFAPAAQLINPKKADSNGKRLVGYDARFVPSSGNDEFRLVAA